ncbi:MAG: LysR family transcriptional regulator [Acidiferrobacterales bacterium]|jgi:molybdate transport repressor ModE-like protein|nr:LysR family transcriptional regulator [Acidiferrobacterales bacterium]
MNNVDWSLIRSFLAVSRHGSLSAAARELGVSQPTLSREIQSLESTTGLNLFRRTTQGLSLTEQGQTLIEAAGHMDDAADQFIRQASGLSAELEGDVRISVNEIIGIYMLPPAIAAFREQHPGVQVEIVITNRASSLSKREADIALRMFQPDQPDLVARRLPDLEMGFYAHRDYVARHGKPATFEEFKTQTILGFDEGMDFINGARALGYEFAKKDFAVRTDHMLAQIALLRAGAGIGGTHVEIARHFPELVRVLEFVPLPKLEFWCVCHADVQFNSRIRAMMQFLVKWFDPDPYAHLLL